VSLGNDAARSDLGDFCELEIFRRLSVLCSATFNAMPFQGQGTVWNLSYTGWRLSGDLPMQPEEILSLTVTFPNEHHIETSEAVVNDHEARNSLWRTPP
jgi:hypothetical protein